MSTTDFYSLSTVCQYLKVYRLLGLCHYVHYCLLNSIHCLTVPHTVPSLGSLLLGPLLSSTVCPLSVSTSQCTVSWFSATVSILVFYSLSNICQYLTMYRLLGLCQYVHYGLLQSVQCLSVHHNVSSVGSVSLCPMLPSTVCPMSVNTSYCTDCWVSATMYNYCLLQSVHCLSVPYTLPSVGCLPLCPILLSTVCPPSASTSQCTVCCFCVTMTTAAFYSLSPVCQYLTMYRQLGLCHYVHNCLSQSAHCLSVPHSIPTDGSQSLCPLLPCRVCQPSVSTSDCTDCWVSVTMSTTAFYSLSTICQYLTLYRLLVLCHYVHYCLLQSVQCL